MSIVIRVLLLLVCAGAGYAAVSQLQNSPQTNAADSRDILELRQTLREEQKHRQELYERIRENERLLEEYETEQKNSTEYAMKEAVSKLEKKAGLTEVNGKGVEIEIKAASSDRTDKASSETSLSPALLRRLVNELFRFGADDISIEGERIIETTALRDIGGVTHINGKRLTALPLKVQVLTDEPEEVHNQFTVSESVEYLSLENLEASSEIEENITIPAYDEIRRVRHMEAAEEE
ncbi:DUF881 domain-containing protein [Alteribacillus sp. JSM 102045]|uniref:DUF881 domain-containing protein n=1 Tax=Alteribacillus sp. JSM 102045 TaxID=1562101 RepID=UPI0035BF93B9